MSLSIKRDILVTLAYFDMFDYPLTYQEVFLFLGCRCRPDACRETLDSLSNLGLVYRFNEFYALKNDCLIVTRRKQGNEKAAQLMEKARQVGRFLIKFPYVRGIGVSGSLSKNYADEKSDIDLFIITRRDRLWVARTLMHCFKKLTFLVNRQHYYCMNYYVDEQQLEIVEKNIYTAIELTTLVPLEGDAAFADFYAANTWARTWLPNTGLRVPAAHPPRSHLLKSLSERLLSNALGNWLERILMHITVRRWGKKTVLKKRNARGTIMGMAAGRHVAKPDPLNFQVKLLEKYRRKLSALLERAEMHELW